MALINSLEKFDGGHFEIDLYWALIKTIILFLVDSLPVKGLCNTAIFFIYMESPMAMSSANKTYLVVQLDLGCSYWV